ncbi:MAG: tetratricopeptide repeat protein [Cyanobacteria bacterium P01_D01_bin.50]
MKIKNQVTLAFSIILIFAGAVTAQTQPTPSSNIVRQAEELKRLRREKEIEDIVQYEVDRSVGERFERTTSLLDANMNIINFWLIVLPLIITITFWALRISIIKGLESEIRDKLKDIDDKYKEIENKILETSKMFEDLEKDIDQLKEDVTHNFESTLKDVTQKFETTANKLKEKIKSQTENLEEKILEEVLSEAQIRKARIFQRLSKLILTLEKISDTENSKSTNQVDIQKQITEQTNKLNALLAEDPNLFFSTDDYINLGNALFHENRYKDAIVCYDKVLEREESSYLALTNRGRCLKKLKQYKEALLSYEKAIEIKPDNHIAWYGKANTLRDLQRYDEAIAAYNKSLELNSDFHWAWYNKASSHALKGETELALKSLDRAIELNPDKYREVVKDNPDFESMKDLERFKKLIEQ